MSTLPFIQVGALFQIITVSPFLILHSLRSNFLIQELKHDLDFSIYVVSCMLFYNFCELPQAVCKLSHVGIYLERGIFTITATFEFFCQNIFLSILGKL